LPICARNCFLPIYCKRFPIYYLPVRYFKQMSPATRKTISFVCLVFTILWFVWIGLRETHYVRSVIRHQTGLHDILGTIYEEQIEGINFLILVIFLIPGVFAWFMYRRFRSEY
jgi:hypothetical protein